MVQLLEDKKVTVMTRTTLNAVIDDGVEVILPNMRQWGLEADLVAIAVGMKTGRNFTRGSSMHLAPMEGVIGEMAMKAKEVHLIGDCAVPGRIREATQEGERVGRWL
jgi:NADH dehydrogenase FAD-containing subunit